MKLETEKVIEVKQERVYNHNDPIQAAAHTDGWAKTSQRPDKQCKVCYGRGHNGYDIVRRRYIICGCVKIRKEK